MTAVRVRTTAPAKINLSLHVGSRRPDGFHELSTVFQAISLSDEIEVAVDPAGAGIRLEVEGADVGPTEENLAWRAVRGFGRAFGEPGGVEVRLRKRIPAGAGLGGGSSDAAAVLRCLGAVTGAADPESLADVGAELGSDVPFFLGASPLASATGRGERVDPLNPLEVRTVLVATPPVHVSTGEAYGALAAARGTSRVEALPAPPPNPSWDDVGDALGHNDFEALVARRHPEVARALGAMKGAGVEHAMLSGSGAAVFGVLRPGVDPRRISMDVAKAAGCPVVTARTLRALPRVDPVPAQRQG